MMDIKLMLLNVASGQRPLLLKVPADYSERDALRQVTALVASAQQEGTDERQALEELLEDHGFTNVEFIVGPSIG